MSGESVPDELAEAATAAVVQTHHDEQMAFLRGESPANQWRPEQYARAVLSAVSEAGWVRAGDLAELRLDYESLSASVAERIRRRDEAIMHAVRLERERDEARAQAEALRAELDGSVLAQLEESEREWAAYATSLSRRAEALATALRVLVADIEEFGEPRRHRAALERAGNAIADYQRSEGQAR